MFSQVKFEYIIEILRDVYQEIKLENVKCLNFANILKKLTREDTNPLYKGFNLDQFSLNFQCIKWAATASNLVLYNDPFVAKHKNNYKLLRTIHYLEKKRNLPKLNLINDNYDDWRSEITRWFNKNVTDEYSNKSKQLFLYGENYTEFQEFIKKMMGNYTVDLKKG